MASASVFSAVQARLEANWSRSPVVNLNDVSEAQDPPWVTFQVPLSNEEQITIGAPGQNVFRESGVLRLVLAIPRGARIAPWLEWMDDLRALFRSRQFDGVRTYGASPAVLDDRNDDGKFWLLSAAVLYDADIHA
ncbi:hypothetical protein [Ancylobacter mangrovi]|uniref:hypothetical protein n=1 Tax=Ancylobacter mangrovi TaxID=2972472 RepID=UPI002163C2EF|nr:hypothetical protein [Ancylobacter mangrovi]MCS0501620.1 hypothetical protein [Ancylobacter mangrovi]